MNYRDYMANTHFYSLKTVGVSKKDFIKQYPLSLLKRAKLKEFWDACFQLKLVNHSYTYEGKREDFFENKLFDMIEEIDYLDSESKYTENDIVRLFKIYRKRYCETFININNEKPNNIPEKINSI